MVSLVSLLGVLLEVFSFHSCLFVPAVPTSCTSILAAVFFCVYDTLKRVLADPSPPRAGQPHDICINRRSGAWCQYTTVRTNLLIVHMTLIAEGSLSHTCANGGDQDSVTDVLIWRNGQFFPCYCQAGMED
jgi:hypothetical protein